MRSTCAVAVAGLDADEARAGRPDRADGVAVDVDPRRR